MNWMTKVSVAAGFALAAGAYAQPTDNCADAPVLGSGTYDFDLSSATNDGTTGGACGASGTNADVWFKHTAAVDGMLTVETCGLAGFDTVLQAFDACGGTSLLCNDDSCGTLQSRIGVPATAGTTYFIRIAVYGLVTPGAGQFRVTAPTAPPPGMDWNEDGDAGDLPGTAQVPSGTDHILHILGTLDVGDADMYRIRVCEHAMFDASLEGGAAFDTQLFLFNSDGVGVAFNDDTFGLLSHLSAQFVATDGDYYLAISGYNNDCSSNSGLIWNNTPFGTERAPDGPGAAEPIVSWGGGGASGTYSIALLGVCFPGGGGRCVADFDDGSGTGMPDGGVTIDDLLYYLGLYTDGNVAADVDNGTFTNTRDGGVTIDDLLYFLFRYSEGC